MTSSEVAAMRTAVESMFSSAYTVLRDVQTPDGAGGTNATSTEASTGACSIHPVKDPAKTIYAERIGTRQAWLAALPHDADVLDTDRLKVDGATYQVIGILPHLTHLQVVTVSLS